LADSPWFVYVLKCSDNSFYVGIAQDIQERLDRHQTKRGAEYTKVRLPVELVYVESLESRSKALLREKWLKRQTRSLKEQLIQQWQKASPKRG
jgi:putative endonuclease